MKRPTRIELLTGAGLVVFVQIRLSRTAQDRLAAAVGLGALQDSGGTAADRLGALAPGALEGGERSTLAR